MLQLKKAHKLQWCINSVVHTKNIQRMQLNLILQKKIDFYTSDLESGYTRVHHSPVSVRDYELASFWRLLRVTLLYSVCVCVWPFWGLRNVVNPTRWWSWLCCPKEPGSAFSLKVIDAMGTLKFSFFTDSIAAAALFCMTATALQRDTPVCNGLSMKVEGEMSLSSGMTLDSHLKTSSLTTSRASFSL